MPAPAHLRVEHLDEPFGITARNPRLSWQLPAGSKRQLAYQRRAGEWDSGRVDSDPSSLVRYAGPPMRSGERVTWTVKVWTDAGESNWAEAACWEMGLVDADDWTARWVEPAESEGMRARTPRPAYLLRHSFTLDDDVERARLYATAHGIYECFLNGRRVGDCELTPGFTSYWSNLQVQAYDVTELLEPGANVLGAIVSDGWVRGQNSGLRLTDLYGTSVGLLAQLNVEGVNGSITQIGTGPDWVSRTGSIREADLIQGQATDFRQNPPGWSTGAASDGWSPVTVRDCEMARLQGSPAPPVRRVEELRPVAVTRPKPGRHVVDLGQNINGWVRLTDLGTEDTGMTLTYGEALGRVGDVRLDNIVVDVDFNPAYKDLPNLTLPFQQDHVTSAGRPEGEFEPHHTIHGFRYVRIEGHPGELTTDDVTGVAVHTDLRRPGWFGCSDERINRLHEAAVWSFRGNACDIPTDCPTRERTGWTDDWHFFVPAAAFLYDVAGFSTKWLRDLAAEQQSDGLASNYVPEQVSAERASAVGYAHGCAGWGDAAVIVPWEIYRAYGDRDLLAEQWSSMSAWVDYAAREARERRHASRIAARPTAAPHEKFLWDTGFHWGEWLEPVEWELNNLPGLASADHGDVATAYLHCSSRLLADIAELLGRGDDMVRYRELAAATRAAWQAEFIQPDGMLTRDTQATYVRAFAFDLVPEDLRPQIAKRLVDLIRQADTHLGSGFLATPYLLPVLADAGHLDVAYELLFQDTEPSWLTMVDRGATTIWEGWNGVDENGDPHLSLNHYGKGAVISFLHRYVAGIRLLDEGPAYRRFRIAPEPGGGIMSATASLDSPYGRIESSWRIDGDRFGLNVTVPAGTTAEICLPDGNRVEAAPGTSYFECHG